MRGYDRPLVAGPPKCKDRIKKHRKTPQQTGRQDFIRVQLTRLKLVTAGGVSPGWPHAHAGGIPVWNSGGRFGEVLLGGGVASLKIVDDVFVVR